MRGKRDVGGHEVKESEVEKIEIGRNEMKKSSEKG